MHEPDPRIFSGPALFRADTIEARSVGDAPRDVVGVDDRYQIYPVRVLEFHCESSSTLNIFDCRISLNSVVTQTSP